MLEKIQETRTRVMMKAVTEVKQRAQEKQIFASNRLLLLRDSVFYHVSTIFSEQSHQM